MENLRYYRQLSESFPRSNPKAIMRRYDEAGVTKSESYRFNGDGWAPTEFFTRYELGHNEDDYIEVPKEEAEEAIAAKLRRRAERGL